MARISFKSTMWYLSRPSSYVEYLRKFRLAIKKRFSKQLRSDKWCQSRAITIKDMVLRITGGYKEIDLPEIEAANGVLLYNLAEYLGATRIVETGVDKGRSSWVLLESLKNRNGKLISTDIPLPEKWIKTGSLVPQELKCFWELIRLPDRIGLPMILDTMPEIDMCYYDSDKSYEGRMFAYPLLWNALREGGILISDDINSNFGFKDFCERNFLEALIAENSGRYIGVILKKRTNNI